MIKIVSLFPKEAIANHLPKQKNESIQSLSQQVSDAIKHEKEARSKEKSIFQKFLGRYWKRKELKSALREIDNKIAALANHLMGHREELKNETVVLINNLHDDYEQLFSLKSLMPLSLLSVPLKHLEAIEAHVRETLSKELFTEVEEFRTFCDPLVKEREEAEDILKAFRKTGEIDEESFAKLNILKRKHIETCEKAKILQLKLQEPSFHSTDEKLEQKRRELERTLNGFQNEALAILEKIEHSVIAFLNDKLLQEVNELYDPIEKRVEKERKNVEKILEIYQNTGQIDANNAGKIDNLRRKNQKTCDLTDKLIKRLGDSALKSSNQELEKEKFEFRKDLGRCLDESLYTSILIETLYLKNITNQLEDIVKIIRNDAKTHGQQHHLVQECAKLEKELEEGLNQLDNALKTIVVIEEESEINAQNELKRFHEKKRILDYQLHHLPRLKDELDRRLAEAKRQHNLNDRLVDTLDFSTNRLAEYQEIRMHISENMQKSGIPEEWAPLLQEIDETIEFLKKTIFEAQLRRHMIGYEDVKNQEGSERDRLDDMADRHLKEMRENVEKTLSSFSEYIETIKDPAKQRELREFFYEQKKIAKEQISQLGNSIVGAYLMIIEEDNIDVVSNERRNDEKKIMELYEVLNDEQKKNVLERLKMLPILSKTKMINEGIIMEAVTIGRQLDKVIKDVTTVMEEMEAMLSDFSAYIETIENEATQKQMKKYLQQRGDIAREHILRLGNNSVVDASLKKIGRDYEEAFSSDDAITEEFLQNLTEARQHDEKKIEELRKTLISQNISDDKTKRNSLANLQNFPLLNKLKIISIAGPKKMELQKTLRELYEEQNKWVSSKDNVNRLREKAKKEAKSIARMIKIFTAILNEIPPDKGNIEENKNLIATISDTIGELASLKADADIIVS